VVGSLLLVSCTEETRPTPDTTPTPTSVPPSPTPNIIDLGINNIASLGKYRYTLDISATGIDIDAQLRGEYFTPNLGVITGTIGGVDVEQLVAGHHIYIRKDDGNWARISSVERTPVPGSENQVVSADTLAANPHPLMGFKALLQNSTGLVDRGQETLNGARVRRIDYRIDPVRFYGESSADISKQLGGPIPDFGGGTVWLDPTTNHIHKFTVTIDLAEYTELSSIMSSLNYMTPTPGGPTPTPVPPSSLTIAMTVRDHNDPGIVVIEPSPAPVQPPTSTPSP
jgi:hypothetical protein